MFNGAVGVQAEKAAGKPRTLPSGACEDFRRRPSIQMYEQRVNDIDKAQAQTIYKLSRVIGCSMEDLLEKPME